MKNAGSKGCICFPFNERIGKVLHRSGSTTCNYGYIYAFRDQFSYIICKAIFSTIIVHGGKQNFSGTHCYALFCPFDGFYLRFYFSSIQINIPVIIFKFCIDR